MWSGYINRIDEYLDETITKIKKRWLKSDKQELERLKQLHEQAEKETDIAREKYYKLRDKEDRLQTKIDKLYAKYSYEKKVKVKNPHYDEEYHAI